MKIIYTEITSSLTEILVEELRKLRSKEKGKRIFYIVPSSLSFEKEREVLEQKKLLESLSEDEETALFDVLVTRFKQLPYYFQNQLNYSKKTELSNIGVTMLFRKILKEFQEGELLYFDKVRDSQGFIEKLVQLRTEMKTANFTVEDLYSMNLKRSEKIQDLTKILGHFEEELREKFVSEDSYECFIEAIIEGNYQEQIQNSIFIVAGFTRFTAQESLLVRTLDQDGTVILGTYASERALRQHKDVIGVYSDPVKLIDSFTGIKSAETEKRETKTVNEVYNKLTVLWEEECDFLQENNENYSFIENKNQIELWEDENVDAEIEMLAKQIRQKIVFDKESYKNFTVFLSNVEKYELPIKRTFEAYDIPYFYSQQELMRNHPFVTFLESLLAILKNNYQIIDLVNLLKTELYTNKPADLEFLDYFEYYLKKFKIHGKSKFELNFEEKNYPENPSENHQKSFEKINEVEKIRKNLISKSSPLGKFLTLKKTSSEKLIFGLIDFLNSGNIPENFQKLYENSLDNILKDKHQQVWKLFQETLREFQEIFAGISLSLEEFLDLLVSGVKNASYRQVPANVDSVNIRDYELVEPRENDYVYVLGLTSSNFPHLKQNSTLLTEEEREIINSQAETSKFFESLESSNLSKNNFTILSLLNAAKKKLVLSSPQIFENSQESEMAPVLQLLKDKEVPVKKVYSANVNEGLIHIGTLSSTIQSILLLDLTSQGSESNFWIKIKDYLSERSQRFAELVKIDNDDIKSEGLSKEISDKVYSHLTASASSFEEFYNCEYKYFLDKTLGLKELEEVTIESSTIGNYFHRIFQLALNDGFSSVSDFHENLKRVKKIVDQEYEKVFNRDALSLFTKANLSEIIEESAVMIKKSFEFFQIYSGNTEKAFSKIDGLPVKGKIDRIDNFGEFLGAIDYKSGKHDFSIRDVYNKTSLQLLTYLAALSKNAEVWGALYLHLQNPILNLSELNNLGEVNQKLLYQMSYRGLFNKEILKDKLSQIDFINLTNSQKISGSNQFTSQEINGMLSYNKKLYQEAIKQLQSSRININPVFKRTDDQYNVTGCRFCQYKSICRFEATRHRGREINLLNEKPIDMKKDSQQILDRITGRTK